MIIPFIASLLAAVSTADLGSLTDSDSVVTGAVGFIDRTYSNDVGSVEFAPRRFGDSAVLAACNEVVVTNFVPYIETNIVTYVDAITNIVEVRKTITNYVPYVVTNYVWAKESTGVRDVTTHASYLYWLSMYASKSHSGWGTLEIFTSNMVRQASLDTDMDRCYGCPAWLTVSSYDSNIMAPTYYSYQVGHYDVVPSVGFTGPVQIKKWVGPGAETSRVVVQYGRTNSSQNDVTAVLSNTVDSAGNPFSMGTSDIEGMTKGNVYSSYANVPISLVNKGPTGGEVTLQYEDFKVVEVPSGWHYETNEVIEVVTVIVTNVTDLVITNLIPRVHTNSVLTAVVTDPLVKGRGVLISLQDGKIAAYSVGGEGESEFSNAVASVVSTRTMSPGHNDVLVTESSGVVSVDVDPSGARSSVSVATGFEMNVPSVDSLTVGGRVVGGRRIGGKTYASAMRDYLDLGSSASVRTLSVSNINAEGESSVALSVIRDTEGNSISLRDRTYRRSGSDLRYSDGGALEVTRSTSMTGVVYSVYVRLDEVGEWTYFGDIRLSSEYSISGVVGLDGLHLRAAHFTRIGPEDVSAGMKWPWYKSPGVRYTSGELIDIGASSSGFTLDFNDEVTQSAYYGGNGRRLWVEYFTWLRSGADTSPGSPAVIERSDLTGMERVLEFRIPSQDASVKFVMTRQYSSASSESDGVVLTTGSVESGRIPIRSIHGAPGSGRSVTGDGTVVSRSDPFSVVADWDIRYYGTVGGVPYSIVLNPYNAHYDSGSGTVTLQWKHNGGSASYSKVGVEFSAEVGRSGTWTAFKFLNDGRIDRSAAVTVPGDMTGSPVFEGAEFYTGASGSPVVGTFSTERIPGSAVPKSTGNVVVTNEYYSISTSRDAVSASGLNFSALMSAVLGDPAMRGVFSNAIREALSPVTLMSVGETKGDRR